MLLLALTCFLLSSLHNAAAVGSITSSVIEVINFASYNVTVLSPENLAFDSDMNMYVTSAYDGKVMKLARTGQNTYNLAKVVNMPGVGAPSPCPQVLLATGTSGIAFKDKKHFFVAHSGCNVGPNSGQGIYLFNIKTMNYTKVSTTIPSDCPGPYTAFGITTNGLALLGKHVYVADMFCGRVLRMSVNGGPLTVWQSDSELQAPPPDQLPDIYKQLGYAPGVNGLKVYKDSLYYTNSARATFGKMRIKKDGSAGTVKVIKGAVNADDFVFDQEGTAWIALHAEDAIGTLDQKGDFKVVLTNTSWPHGPQGPSACAFGVRGTSKNSLYCTQFPLPYYPNPRPSVTKVPVSVNGLKLGYANSK